MIGFFNEYVNIRFSNGVIQNLVFTGCENPIMMLSNS
jgi:hypothetical protein